MSKILKTPIDEVDKPKKRGKTDKPKRKGKNAASGTEAGATRAAVLDMLKREGERTAAEIGTALGVTSMAARLQLYALEEEGLVHARSEPQGRGRPQKIWSLTEASSRVFPDAHQSLAVEMIQSVDELFGAEGLAKFVKKHGDMQRKAYGELMDCQPSRFLDELPADDLEWEGRADKEDPEKKQARGKDAIAGLRSLLG
mgnify:CR=1 FL=1